MIRVFLEIKISPYQNKEGEGSSLGDSSSVNWAGNITFISHRPPASIRGAFAGSQTLRSSDKIKTSA